MDSEELIKRAETIRRYENILKSIPFLMTFLDERNSMSLEKLHNENFIPLFNSIDKKIQLDLNF